MLGSGFALEKLETVPRTSTSAGTSMPAHTAARATAVSWARSRSTMAALVEGKLPELVAVNEALQNFLAEAPQWQEAIDRATAYRMDRPGEPLPSELAGRQKPE